MKKIEKLEELVGKEVRIYPGDTYEKRGIILDITPFGILFRITYYCSGGNAYTVGKEHFISYSKNLDFEVI